MLFKFFCINVTYSGAINNLPLTEEILHDQCPEKIHCCSLGVSGHNLFYLSVKSVLKVLR